MSRINAVVALAAMVVTIAVVAPLLTTGLPWAVVAAITVIAAILVAGSAVGYLVRSVTDPEVTDG